MNQTDVTLRTHQVAELLGISGNTVRRLAEEGVLPVAFKTRGGHDRFKLSDVLAYREARSSRSQEED